MRIIRNLTFLFFVVIITFVFIKCLKAEVDPYSKIIIPIFSKGYNIKRFIDKPKGTKSVNYFAKSIYPAREVLEFYDTKFREMGWKPSFRGDFGKKEWDSFIDDTIEGSPKIRQLIALWINPKLKNEFVLVLRYKKFNKETWNDELQVISQIQQTIDTTKIEKFFTKLKKVGEFVRFMELLDSYRLENGDVDIDHAVKENKNNKYLIEYYKLFKNVSPK